MPGSCTLKLVGLAGAGPEGAGFVGVGVAVGLVGEDDPPPHASVITADKRMAETDLSKRVD